MANDPQAKAHNPTDRVAAAMAKAQAFMTASKEALGTMYGLSEDFAGYWFVPDEIGDGRATALRRDLASRGYTHAPQAGVSQISGAEVWEIPNVVLSILRGQGR